MTLATTSPTSAPMIHTDIVDCSAVRSAVRHAQDMYVGALPPLLALPPRIWEEARITRMVNCTSNLTVPEIAGVQVLQLEINHIFNVANTRMRQAFTAVSRVLSQCRGHVTLFACEHGAHRSTLAAAVALVMSGFRVEA